MDSLTIDNNMGMYIGFLHRGGRPTNRQFAECSLLFIFIIFACLHTCLFALQCYSGVIDRIMRYYSN